MLTLLVQRDDYELPKKLLDFIEKKIIINALIVLRKGTEIDVFQGAFHYGVD